jgi:hypothetical protein
MMMAITIRAEKEITKIIDTYSKSYGYKPSIVIRDWIEAGVAAKKKYNVYLKTQFNSQVLLEKISLGSEQSRLNFYLDPSILSEAKTVFKEDDQAVLRRALRLAIFSLSNTMKPIKNNRSYVPAYQIYIEVNQEQVIENPNKASYCKDEIIYKHTQNMTALGRVMTFFVTSKIREIIQKKIAPFLNESSERQTLILAGPQGIGKTSLAEYVLAIAGNLKLTETVQDQELKSILDSFAGKYVPIRLTSDADDIEQLTRRLIEYDPLPKQEDNTLLKPIEKLMYLLTSYSQKHPDQKIIIYKEIETPPEAAKHIQLMKLLFDYPLKTLLETNSASIVDELVNLLPNAAIVKLDYDH